MYKITIEKVDNATQLTTGAIRFDSQLTLLSSVPGGIPIGEVNAPTSDLPFSVLLKEYISVAELKMLFLVLNDPNFSMNGFTNSIKTDYFSLADLNNNVPVIPSP